MKNNNTIQNSISGTLESSDIQIMLEPADNGIEISLTSPVKKQFGKQIMKVIADTLDSTGITDAKITANDNGALDCTIKARVLTACHRALGKTTQINWEDLI